MVNQGHLVGKVSTLPAGAALAYAVALIGAEHQQIADIVTTEC